MTRRERKTPLVRLSGRGTPIISKRGRVVHSLENYSAWGGYQRRGRYTSSPSYLTSCGQYLKATLTDVCEDSTKPQCSKCLQKLSRNKLEADFALIKFNLTETTSEKSSQSSYVSPSYLFDSEDTP